MHKSQTKAFIFIADILSLTLAVILSGLISRYISTEIIGSPYYDLFSGMALGRVMNFATLSAITLFLFYSHGHYSKRIPWWNQVGYIISVLSFMLLLEVFMHFAVRNQISRLWIFSSWIFAFFFILLGRQMVKIICEYFNIWQIKTVIIGDKNNIIETAFALHSESYAGYNLTTLIIGEGYENFDVNDLPIVYKNVEIIDGSTNYNHIIKENKESFYIIAPDSFDNLNIENLIHKITTKTSNYAVVPATEGIKLYGSKPQYFFGHDVIFLPANKNINSPMSRLVKRIMDIIGSLLGIILLSPILLIVYFLIRKDSGPAFFIQNRIGRDCKIFKCYKFRTMKVNAEESLQNLLKNDPEKNKLWQTHRKIIDDPRITKVGKYLRSSSIDEFPQLFNVLKGDMSLVGPRPMLPDEVIFFNEKELKNYASIKPGITGLWQVSGRNNVSFKKRVHFDNWYVQNWSLWHDIVIVIKTIFVVIKRVGAR